MIACGKIISRLDLSPAKAGELFVGHLIRNARLSFDLFTYLTMMGYEELRQLGRPKHYENPGSESYGSFRTTSDERMHRSYACRPDRARRR